MFQAQDGFDFDLEEDTPTEEMIERMEEKLESAQSEQKNLFLIIFQVSNLMICRERGVLRPEESCKLYITLQTICKLYLTNSLL